MKDIQDTLEAEIATSTVGKTLGNIRDALRGLDGAIMDLMETADSAAAPSTEAPETLGSSDEKEAVRTQSVLTLSLLDILKDIRRKQSGINEFASRIEL